MVFTVSAQNYELCDNVWLLESWASLHMRKNKIWFIYLIPESKDVFQANKNSKIILKDIGKISCKTISKNNCIHLTINNVSFVPDLRYDLLSVTVLMDKDKEL